MLAALKPPNTDQIGECEFSRPIPLESPDGTVLGKLSTKLLLQASVNIDQIPCPAQRAALHQVLQLQQVACAIQQSGRNSAHSVVRGGPQEANRQTAPLCGFAFQERVCLAQFPCQPGTGDNPPRPEAHIATAANVVREDIVNDGEYNSQTPCMQKVGTEQVAATWHHVQLLKQSAPFTPLKGGKVALLVGTGHITEQLQGSKQSFPENPTAVGMRMRTVHATKHQVL